MKAVKTILIGLCTFALIYLAVAFVIWDLNASNWQDKVRFIVVYLGGSLAFLLSSIYYFVLHK